MSAISTGLIISSPPNFAGRENRLRSRSDRIVSPVVLVMRDQGVPDLVLDGLQAFSYIRRGPHEERHIREEPQTKAA